MLNWQVVIIKKFKIIILSIILFVVTISYCSSYSDTVFSGIANIYHVRSLEGENFAGPDYKFYWVASDGAYDSCTDSVFKWTPPVVSEARNVTITAYVANSIDDKSTCVGKDEIKLMVLPRQNGGIRLEKTLLSDKDDVKTNDILTYRICITNTGNSRIVSLPLIDDYPEQFLEAVNSELPWDEDTGSVLAWDDLLNSPLEPGQSIITKISFKAIASTDLVVVNLAEVIGAKDENENLLGIKTSVEKFSGISFNCPAIGPESGYAGVPVAFSAPLWQDGYKWNATDGEGRSVEGFNDPGKAVVTWTPPYSGTFTISYNSLCRYYISIKEPALYISKKSANEVCSPRDTVKYTIDYGNYLDLEADDVTVYDVLPEVEYVNSTPEPDYIKGNTLIWKMGTMQPGTNGSIDLFVRIKEQPDITFKESQSVYGEGYVYFDRRLSTTTPPESLRNYANITAFHGREFNSSNSTILVQDSEGSEVRSTGHGSGTYSREIESQLSSPNSTIQIQTDLSESFGISSFSLPAGRSINHSSRWSEMQMARNRETGSFSRQQIMYASMIQSNNSVALDKNGSTVKSEISFDGAGHFREQKMPSNDSSCCNEPAIYDSAEDYLGGFRIDKRFDEYGKNVVLVHSASGNGSISSEKNVKNRQKSYHSGTGTYQINEQIQTQTSYMDKFINARYGSLNYSYKPEFAVSISKKWTEGMWSRSGELSPIGSVSSETSSYIAEEISNADFINKSTVAGGLKNMKTQADFSGTARFEASSGQSIKNKSDGSASIYQEYSGVYRISRNLMIEGTARFDEPHINATVSGKPANGGEFIDYVITVTNDGTRALGPISITDYYPPGTGYVSSSLRPAELNRSFARWTLIDLGIGSSTSIELKLDATYEQADSLVNKIKVLGNYSDKWVEAEALSALQLDWLGCCPPDLAAAKTAEADLIDPMLVHYCIALTNHNNQSITATVRDMLPGGMVFQGSSFTPTDHSTGEILWTIVELLPGETRHINYTAKAMQRGVYVNQARIEAYSVEGASYARADVASRIEIPGSQNQENSSARQAASCLGLSYIEQDWTEEWMPCDAGENAQGDPATWGCSSCIASSSGDLDVP